MMETWIRRRGVSLRGGGLDESPHVYRRLPDVLAAQGRTVEVVHTLRPLIVVMAGADEVDPYRD
jgi:tRNA-splicing ligase RtcB (3'-phosphate/5'-hydroxy nucleic acid ligase)